MPFDYDHMIAWEIPLRRQSYSEKDTILYALSLGFGEDPVDPAQLRHVYEDGLKAFATLGSVLGYAGFWLQDPGVGADWKQVVHGEQQLVLHRPLPVSGEIVGHTRVTQVVDKGEGRGAIVVTERKVTDAQSGEPLCTVIDTVMCRGDGGCGGPGGSLPRAPAMPEREPDHVVTLATLPQAALIYRLNGDMNPLHAEPGVAAAAGFERPILHGLATMGVAARALASILSGGLEIREFAGRFTAPVMPGQTLVTQVWDDGAGGYLFRVLADGRAVMDGGRAAVTDWAARARRQGGGRA